MKKLLFNFLFFVVAALILIQCAFLFPSNDAVQKPRAQAKPAITGNNKHGKLIATITDVSVGGN